MRSKEYLTEDDRKALDNIEKSDFFTLKCHKALKMCESELEEKEKENAEISDMVVKLTKMNADKDLEMAELKARIEKLENLDIDPGFAQPTEDFKDLGFYIPTEDNGV